MSTTSPLAPASFPVLPPVGGVQLATHAAGLKYSQRDDVMLAALPESTSVGAVFTQSLCPSAPVDWCRQVLAQGSARALVCNSGNANAFTGRAGASVASLTAETIAGLLGFSPNEAYLASTGVIGEPIPEATLMTALPELVEGLADSGPVLWEAAANAIRTTDTFAKGAHSQVVSTNAVVVGIAKGSGMIAPDMATMLSFVFTDLPIAAPVLQAAVSAAAQATFNCITVDSDTSTSDTVLVFATGASGDSAIADAEDPRLEHFSDALTAVMRDLAHQIVRDGEGATKFVEVSVLGAEDDMGAKVIASSIANSPLVKTALAAEDANWGRVVMAVGKAGQAADRDNLRIWIGDELTADNGVQAPGYSEARATAHLCNDEVRIKVDVGVGSGAATVWTCDLTHGYIDINAGYRS